MPMANSPHYRTIPERSPSVPDAKANASDQARLVAALADPARFGPGCARVTVLETHISYVLLTGRHAYKLKKAVDLGFLDFTTLDGAALLLRAGTAAQSPPRAGALSRRRRDHGHARRPGDRRQRAGARIRGEDARIPAGGAGQPRSRARNELGARGHRRAGGEGRGVPRHGRVAPPADGAFGTPDGDSARRAREFHRASTRAGDRRQSNARSRALEAWTRERARRAQRGIPRAAAARLRPRMPRRSASRQHRA